MATSTHDYDFVIIGGGTSGLAVAARLTEIPSIQVLVLEAGEDLVNDPRISMPAGWPALLGSDFDWDFATVPQSHLNGRSIGHPQGRVLGGSSAINAEAFIAPSKVGMDAWESFGNPDWSWEAMAPYYRKFHTLTAPSEAASRELGVDYIDEKIRGTSGPIQASFTGAAEHTIGKAWVDTFKALSYGATGDPFSGKMTGGYTNPVSIDPVTKTRSYSAVAYYVPAKDRPNLHLMTGAFVEQIILEKVNGDLTATGVKFSQQGTAQEAKARKEVILAAGTFNSPKLLELSGIGKRSVLESHGIPVHVENDGVGENLQDHLMSGISYEAQDGVPTLDELSRQNPELLQAAMMAYSTNQSGPLSAGSVNSFAIMPAVDCLVPGVLERLVESHPADASASAHPAEQLHFDFVRSVLASSDEGSAAYYMYPVQANYAAAAAAQEFVIPSLPGNYLTLGVVLLHPFSRGSSHIASASPAAKPTIDARYLSHGLDVELFARHLRYLETVAATAPLAALLKPGGRRNAPAAFLGRDGDLEAAKAYVRAHAVSNWHVVGTCAMMARDKGGVVDARLRVHGVKGLRVVDASIMPVITRGNPQTTVYAVAERAADFVKGEYGLC